MVVAYKGCECSQRIQSIITISNHKLQQQHIHTKSSQLHNINQPIQSNQHKHFQT